MSVFEGISVRRASLYSLIASVLLSAFLGIYAILSGRFGEVEIKILLTTVTVSASSICGLACGANLGKGRGQGVPMSGIGFTVLAAGMIIAGMWADADSIDYWKTASSFSVFAVACGQLSLLSLARLARRFQWSLPVAYGLVFGVASLIVSMIIFEIESEWLFRLLGVGVILVAAITILIPIFRWLSGPLPASTGDETPWASDDAIDAEIAMLRERIEELERKRHRRR